MEPNRNRIGVASLLISSLSLMLSILPPCIIDKDIKEIEIINYFDRHSVSLEIKRVRYHIFQLEHSGSIDGLVEELEKECKIEILSRLYVVFTISMFLAAVTGISMAIYSWSKEDGKGVCIGSITCAIVAMSWQCGILVGVAILVFIFLVASFS